MVYTARETNYKEKEVNIMTYSKPEVVTLGPALDAVQIHPLVKSGLSTPDSFTGQRLMVISAYEADE